MEEMKRTVRKEEDLIRFNDKDFENQIIAQLNFIN